MELRIRDSQGIVDTDFGYWLIVRIRAKLLSNISKYNLINLDNYLTESATLKRLYKKEYKTKDLVVFASNNLVCKGAPGDITIHFDSTKYIPGFDRVKLSTIIKLLNYGSLDIKGCSIFTDTFNHFANDIETYVRLYYMV